MNGVGWPSKTPMHKTNLFAVALKKCAYFPRDISVCVWHCRIPWSQLKKMKTDTLSYIRKENERSYRVLR
jgi:hypothetical protein